ncbi:histone-lysine N-methyltransferase SETD7 isoform X2 [Pundamilia nyererei]|uniref:Histone-lysine N-methyltransferase SETD7 n=1 Tax=Pundamilia nyererei TaxID=303518 RepID=A0A9Y6JKG8_9CICH|nr:PREDICTED: histone-lysine N-methyltransferase SETD7 isoform X2 [Pundamilia nyererei]XP_039866157.1 histone-lysine N-methyltransferase SETD7 isoform X2 [Simochromis diagramma]
MGGRKSSRSRGAVTAVSCSMDSDDENVEEVVEGPLDEDGQPHGFCTVTYSSSDRFEGHFTHGEKNGKGKFFFFDGSTLEGFYVDDALQGQGVYTYEDGGVLNGTYVDGELNGPAQEFDGEGHLVFKGQYKDNNRCGECWVYYPACTVVRLGQRLCVWGGKRGRGNDW